MKKILMFLLVLLSSQGAYSNSDGDDFEVGSFFQDSLDAFYYNDMEDSAIRALCKRFLEFAAERDFRPSYTLTDGSVYYFQEKDCDDDNVGHVKLVTLGIADGIDKSGILDKPQNVQNVSDVPDCVLLSVKMRAWSSKTSVVRSLERQGYNFDFNNSEVACSNTSSDYKCVINVVVNNGAKNYTACYKVPYNVCESGAYFVHSHEVMGKIGIEYYDNNCAPIYGQ